MFERVWIDVLLRMEYFHFHSDGKSCSLPFGSGRSWRVLGVIGLSGTIILLALVGFILGRAAGQNVVAEQAGDLHLFGEIGMRWSLLGLPVGLWVGSSWVSSPGA